MASTAPAKQTKSKISAIGYLLYGHDNRASFFEYEPPPGVLCPKCQCVLNSSFRPTYLPIRTGMDVSSTYDNVPVVSERFVNVCREKRLPGIEFFRFEGRNKPYYFVEVDRVVPFDTKRMGTRFEKKCRECKQFAWVTGVTPTFLKVGGPLSRGFHRSDVAFGCDKGRRTVMLIDLETAALFQSLRLLGMDLHPVEGVNDAI